MDNNDKTTMYNINSIVSKIDVLFEKCYSILSTKNDYNVITFKTNLQHQESLDLFLTALKESIGEKESASAIYDLSDSFSRWLDINVKKSTLSSLNESLILCGITVSENATKEDITNALIKHGIAPHFQSKQISIIQDSNTAQDDSQDIVTHTFKAIYKSHVIGIGNINSSGNEKDKNPCIGTFSINVPMIESLSQQGS